MYKIGKAGSNIYIMNLKDDECAVFDFFGEFQSMLDVTSARIACKDVFVDIDIVSVVGECGNNSKSCEVYLNGVRMNVNMFYLEAYNRLRDKAIRFDSNIYMHKDTKENYMQVLLALKKGKMSEADIRGILS